MMELVEVIDTDMYLSPARHAAGQFFAHKKVWVLPQFFCALNRVMIRQRKQAHAAPTQRGIDILWIAIAFLAEMANKRCRTQARINGVDVHIALHEFQNTGSALRSDDMRAKVLTTQIFNSFDTFTEI